ncbi:hypothetical protein [Stackebrandtia nassauensis]|uniref:WD40 domain protein beta Propeller n=1 Tax=Stackebrandtia nassauensis (strain DSM 44728 / CIP 108903 / NRRL B-16338 / NBRC 102104 / LLR-40K-21) TaxID=446470 RepID=D3QAC3_STANL|nr:hypothetical protein [Stackebrandtia nassauensis]ADD42706.1 hypothetical protein Snas_3035 [Stackebrandtia nassauensis DSM 44728]
MPRNLVLVAVLALGVVAACDGSGSADTEDDGKGSAKPSFANATADELSGTFFYLAPHDDGAAVYSFTGDGKPKPVMTGTADLWSSATPSPDGKYISYVEGSNAESPMRIWDVEAGEPLKEQLAQVDGVCKEPAWTPDSKRLLTHAVAADSPTEATWFDVASGETSKADVVDGCHPKFPVGGDDTVYTFMTGDVTGLVMRDGKKETTLPAEVVKGRTIIDPVAVARDNAGLCVATAAEGEPVGDAARSLSCDTIVDTKTKKPVKLPDTITGAVFPESGGFITRTGDGELKLSDLDDSGIATLEEPSELAEGFLIGYAEPA